MGLVFALLATHRLLAVGSVRNKCQTYDETIHLTAGYAYWKLNDFRLQPENGNLPQRLVSLPLLFLPGQKFPSLEQPAWAASNGWVVGDQFCHQLGNDLSAMLQASRSVAALLGVALCLTVFVWSRTLFGDLGGLLSLLLCALSPTMLAHAPLATSDACTALFFTLASACIWRVLQVVTVGRVLLSALVTAGLFLSKSSAILIVPMTLLMVTAHLLLYRKLLVGWRRTQREVASGAACAGTLAAIVLVHVLGTLAIVWGAYGWRHSPAPSAEGQPRYFKLKTMDEAARHAGIAGGFLYWMSEQHLLPEAYAYGVAFTLAHRQRAAYLNGEHFLKGRPHYFPFCVLVKTPLALFGLLLASAAWGVRQFRLAQTNSAGSFGQAHSLLVSLTPLLVLLVVYWATAIVSSLNIGHRHMLPTYPAMFILAGGAAGWFTRATRLAGGVVVALLLAFAADSARGYPHYLAYFNPLVPRETAYRRLVDSNLDWGQDLPGLKQWLDEHPSELDEQPLYLAYFGTGSPDYYGIRALRLPVMVDPLETPELRAGVYCISATALANVYGEAPGRWNLHYENVYRDTLSTRAQQSAAGQDSPPQDQQATDRLLLWLRLARLYAYLRSREPDDHVGYSLLIYRLSKEQLRAALEGPPAELDRQSWAEREDAR